MPIYDVHCSKEDCKYRGELLSSTLDIADETCPECNEGKLIKNPVQHFRVGRSGVSMQLEVIASGDIICLSCKGKVGEWKKLRHREVQKDRN